jgi:glycine/D-amino acid oxidase-like deaminating enzyme
LHVKSWDTILIGGGIIGLSLAISLHKRGLRVLIVERGEPGREASYAAAGMLVGSGTEIPAPLRDLARESARLYPEFVHELEDESGIRVDLREHGTILISSDGHFPEGAKLISLEQLQSLEPTVAGCGLGRSRLREAGEAGFFGSSRRGPGGPLLYDQRQVAAAYVSERSVDPRGLVSAAIKAARHREVDISSGTEVKAVLVEGGRVSGVQTDKTSYSAATVVNCAGAWAGCVGPQRFPVHPVKGHMLALIGGAALRHVVRAEAVYLVPRSDGRVVVGSTLENVGYNKQTDVNTIQQLFHAAVELVPGLTGSKVHEAWTGLRPGTPDELPILGETSTAGYFVASGHYRDGILLAPVTARLMTDVILDKPQAFELQSLSALRFGG